MKGDSCWRVDAKPKPILVYPMQDYVAFHSDVSMSKKAQTSRNGLPNVGAA